MTSSRKAPSCQHTCRLMPSTENPLRNIEHSQERVCSASEVRVRSHFFVKSHGGLVPGPTPACSIAFLVRSLKRVSEQGERTYSRPCSGRVRRTPFAAATPSLRRRSHGPARHIDFSGSTRPDSGSPYLPAAYLIALVESDGEAGTAILRIVRVQGLEVHPADRIPGSACICV